MVHTNQKSSQSFNADMWSELYNIALIQCHCNLVPATAFAAFHFQLFAFPYAFQFEQGDQHSPSQTCARQYTYEKFSYCLAMSWT